ncbi:putative two-component response regulator-like APRR6 [Capsella rubella]|uniref:putative two-component response regulator-like APRR6 n=1 Tax=Capsella rubella TaxID=81985 RepID=UPI000CD540E6|nr:putative two-component response regulator-like APRR6 [Capsella rubella]
MAENVIPQCVNDIFILLIDHDATSVASLTSMLEQFSKRVMSVDAASKALSMIEKQKKDIGIVIANIEMPQIDSHSFLTALLQRNIPLILINPEIRTKKPSDLLKNSACFSLDKPISEIDIKNMWQRVLSRQSQEFKKINMAENQENAIDKDIDEIENFRASLKRQRTSQASLLGQRNFIKPYTTSEAYHKRKGMANIEWKTKPCYQNEVENRRKEWMKVDDNVGRRMSLWTNERHMKFLAAISILGDNDLRPKSILEIMNDPNLTQRQIASHLQKYKAQIERISDVLPRNEWKSTDKTIEYPSDYDYPFKASYLTKNVIASNSLWCCLRKKNLSSSSSINQFSLKNPIDARKKSMPKLHRGKKLDLSNHSHSGNILNKSSMNVDYVPSTISSNLAYDNYPIDNANHIGMVSTGVGSEILPMISNLPNTCASQMETARISIPHYDPNPLHPHNLVLETSVNQIDLDFTSIPDSFFPQADSCNLEENYFLPNNIMSPLETNIDQMNLAPSIENHSHHGINIIQSEVDNPIDIGFSEVSILPQEESTNHMGIVSCETNMSNFETNANEDFDIPIEDLISFDTDIEKDMASWLEESGFSERNNQMESSEYHNAEAGKQNDNIEGGGDFEDYRDYIDWIDEEVMKKDA